MKSPVASVAALLVTSALAAFAADDLSKILREGEGWQEVGSGYGFTDAACGDRNGNFYFSDLKANTIHKVAPDGKVTAWLEDGPSISGLKFGPDGRLYAAVQAPKKQIIAIAPATKEITVLAENVQPNDLIVSPRGFLYYTDTGRKMVIGLSITAPTPFTAATDLSAPNGIALSPDGNTLAVSEYRGTNVWTWKVGADGRLTDGKRKMTLRTPPNSTVSGGDGMTVDAAGRWHVTSLLGIQIFAPSGELLGVIPRPQDKGLVSCGLAGKDGDMLYACNSDKVFRRKTQVKAAWLFGAK
jgi:enterochelin esterase family protein